MFGFRIVEKLQKLGTDIQKKDLKYHNKRVMVSKEFTFDAAHHLHEYEGKCKNLHGHTYRAVFGISGYVDEIGMMLDFGDIKDIWKEKIETYLDHRYINEMLPPMNTTAENMVVWLFDQMEKELQERNVKGSQEFRVEFVRLFETPTSYAEMRREWMTDE
ncbi:6-carboxytetrahydropterin synthase QueD [Alkalicoccus saliphilus]|jgi:6-pyruvoyltetrahydropterin/6-carboxytetrahydropterin synthase|uniref:6-carboxy-5,6,7,8-tetrahydropterin synthase n=1 Tax=Alkalicoccus saliphilus TaxID=200989 RepID=A0A2T4UA01_9BACI|nr:6-carboxytetrahydropterin synthase QueD [Alkalicoccus saliphilus]PTL40210.1 6-carboxytetrahydropterin synthase QueD [Alkalicoccus saliphilus]